MHDQFIKMIADLLDITRDELIQSAQGLTLDDLDKGLNATREYKYTEGQEFVLRSITRMHQANIANERIEAFLREQGLKYLAFNDSKLLQDQQWRAYIAGVLDALALISDNRYIAKVLPDKPTH